VYRAKKKEGVMHNICWSGIRVVRGTFSNLDGAWLEDQTGVDLLEKEIP